MKNVALQLRYQSLYLLLCAFIGKSSPFTLHFGRHILKCVQQQHDTKITNSIILFSSFITEEITELPSFISDSVFGDIAAQVQSRVKVPPIPSPIVRYVLTQALRSMSKDLSPTLLCQVEELLDSEKTASKDDDLTESEVQKLANAIAHELVQKNVIDVPILDSKQEYEILVQILNVVFSILTTSESERRAAFIESAQQFLAQDLLGTPEGRKVLIQKINAAVDIPIFNEQQEERIFTAAVEACASTLQFLFPPELLRTLKGETDHNNLMEMKQFLILKVNEKVDLVGLNEQQEESLIRTMVDLLIESYVDPTAASILLLNKKETYEDKDINQRLNDLKEDAAALQRKITLSTTRYEREQSNLISQLNEIKREIQALETIQ
jgi:hypothetical protein